VVLVKLRVIISDRKQLKINVQNLPILPLFSLVFNVIGAFPGIGHWW